VCSEFVLVNWLYFRQAVCCLLLQMYTQKWKKQGFCLKIAKKIGYW